MIRFALKSLAGRKLRTVLTALAIVLGVAMMSGAYVLTDTIDKAFDSIFVDSYAGTDAVVTGKDPGFSFEGESAQAPPIPEETLEQVREIDGVEVATGSVQDFQTKLLRPDGEAIDTGGAPSFAFGIDTAPEYDRFNPLNLVEGRWPSGGSEVAVDEGVAGDEDLELGDRIGVAALGPAQQFTIVGIAKYGDLSSIGGATFAIFDVATAQELLDKEGQLDAVTAAAADGTTPEQLTQQIQSELGSDFTVRTGVEQASEESSEIATFTTIIRYFLLSFAGIALFVGAFVIFNTLSITVAQRMREFATLRTLGASRRQVLRSVILEALVIGLGASIVGPVQRSRPRRRPERALQGAEPRPAPDRRPSSRLGRSSSRSLVGTLVTLVAGLFPAIRATRVPPIAAVREGATMPRGRFARFTPYIASSSSRLRCSRSPTGRSPTTSPPATGSPSSASASSRCSSGSRCSPRGSSVRSCVSSASRRGESAARPGKIAERNAQRNPGRTAATAAALMIGIALVTFISVLANGLRVSNSDAIERQIQADLIVTSQDGYSEFPAAVGTAVADVDGVETVSNVRQDIAQIEGDGANLTGLDDEGRRGVRLPLGGRLGRGAHAARRRRRAAAEQRRRGPGPRRRRLHHRALHRTTRRRTSSSAASTRAARSTRCSAPRASRRRRSTISTSGRATVSRSSTSRTTQRPAKTGVESALETFPDTRVQTREEWIDKEDQEIQQFLLLLYVLLALSVIISLFGMVNTLALSVFERTRELGMLRAVGMTRRQTRRMIRHESVITALIGAALGLPLGIFLAALVTNALGQYDLRFELPFVQLIILTVVAVIAGLLAAITPARRAAQARSAQGAAV